MADDQPQARGRFVIYEAHSVDHPQVGFAWERIGDNGQKLGASHRIYTRIEDAARNLGSVIGSEVKLIKSGRYRYDRAEIAGSDVPVEVRRRGVA
jgi:hypothetical protein